MTAFDPKPRPEGFGAAVTMITVAWFLLALNRFGGSATQQARPFARFVLVGLWAWLLVGALLWLMLRIGAGERGPALRMTLTAIGRAHVALAGWAMVLFVAAGGLQLRWPGLISAVIVAGWMPWSTMTTLGAGHEARRRIALAVSAAHVVWMGTAGRFLAARLGHMI